MREWRVEGRGERAIMGGGGREMGTDLLIKPRDGRTTERIAMNRKDNDIFL